MKAKLLFAIMALLGSLTFAQTGINYKAIIKDSGGNIVASQAVDVQFIIYEGAALTDNVYQESHTTITDANGILIVNIGEGTTTDVFTDISWGDDEHWLNVQVDTGAGLVDMGTTQFMAVPYALHASNVTGLEALDEGNGIGYRLLNADPIYYGNIGSRAVDLSYGGDSGYDAGQGAVGMGSVAMGQYTTANIGSVAMGYGTSATGQYSTAMGSNTTASGPFTVAMGESSTATGLYATAMGVGTNANALASMAIGRFNIGGGNPSTWIDTDPLFEIGNGSGSGSKSNALTVLKNGSIIAPSLDMAEITDNKSLITKEYADTNYSGGGSTGLELINEGAGPGWRFVGSNPNNYGDIGWGAVDLSVQDLNSTTSGATGQYSVATGLRTTASANHSTAMGYYSIASGMYSTAMGNNSVASGETATAIGWEANALGDYSIAVGTVATSVGNNSAAIGEGVIAGDPNSIVVGSYNDPNTYSNTVFQVGNGTLPAPSNALTVLNNGDAILAGTLTQSSDIRLKKDIQDLEYGLNEVLALQPKSYHWKKHTSLRKSLGLIAQDVASVIPEIVHETEDDEKTLSISYIELIPVLIKAIREQQLIIIGQNAEISDQASEIAILSEEFNKINELSQRIKQLESDKKNLQQ